jgi:phage replication-related protein YjqB (UPF0714/DUF867 family)
MHRATVCRPERAAVEHGGRYVSLTPAVCSACGLAPGRQVRVEAGTQGAFTVCESREMATDRGITIGARGREILSVEPGERVTVDPTVPTVDSRDEAAQTDGLAESVTGDGTDFLVAAPHAGHLEPGTHAVASALFEAALDRGVDARRWVACGFGAPAFDRWHVHSREFSPDSYPGLATVARRRYGFTVSVHGHSEEYVTVGGTPGTETRATVADALERTLPDDPDVRYRRDRARNTGRTDENFVNWLRAGDSGGVQLELTREYRQHPEAVRHGVLGALSDLGLLPPSR